MGMAARVEAGHELPDHEYRPGRSQERKDQSPIGVDHPHLLDQYVERDQSHLHGDHHRADVDPEEDPVAGKFLLGQGIAGHAQLRFGSYQPSSALASLTKSSNAFSGVLDWLYTAWDTPPGA